MKKKVFAAVLAIVLCFGTIPYTSITASAETPEEDWISWKPSEHDGQLPYTSGNYRLEEDVNLVNGWNATDGITLDLNGHVIYSDNTYNIVILVPENVTLNICDYSSDSKHYYCVDEFSNWILQDSIPENFIKLEDMTTRPAKGTYIEVPGGCISGTNCGGGIMINGTLYMNGGNIVGHVESTITLVGKFYAENVNIVGNNSADYGGGVMIDNKGIFIALDCMISFNTSIKQGGGISANGIFTLDCCKLYGNYAYQDGGAIHTWSNQKFVESIISDCTISNNVAEKLGGGIHHCKGDNVHELGIFNSTIAENIANELGCGVYAAANSSIYLDGNTQIIDNTKTVDNKEIFQNLYLTDGVTVNLSPYKNVPDDMNIGVTTETLPTGNSRVNITAAINKDYSCCFTSDNNSYKIVNKSDGDSQTVQLRTHEHAWSYSAEGNVITAACTDTVGICDVENLTLTLIANDSTYDSKEHGASILETSIAGLESLPFISYYAKDAEGEYTIPVLGVPKSVAEYLAKITINDATATKEYKILKEQQIISIIEGALSKWDKDSKDDLIITSNADFSDFKYVKVDDEILDEANYIAESGSTKITLKQSYLNTLSEGEHTIEIISYGGSAITSFTIKASVPDEPVIDDPTHEDQPTNKDHSNEIAPLTLDNNFIAPLTLLLFMISVMIIIKIHLSRKHNN